MSSWLSLQKAELYAPITIMYTWLMNQTLLIELLLLLSLGFIINIYLQLRVWTTPAQVDQTKYALGVGKDIITYYEQYYNLGYPLPKQGESKCTSNMYVTCKCLYIVCMILLTEVLYKMSYGCYLCKLLSLSLYLEVSESTGAVT